MYMCICIHIYIIYIYIHTYMFGTNTTYCRNKHKYVFDIHTDLLNAHIHSDHPHDGK